LRVDLGLGGKKELNISLNAAESGDSNAPIVGRTAGSWEPGTAFGGALQLAFDTGKAQTLLNYSGNGIAYPNASPMFMTYQNFGFSQSVKVARWTLTAADSVNYSPNSTFGGFGYTLAPANGDANGGSAISRQYLPNQSILTPYTTSYFNTTLGQAEYHLTRRSSWTATGSYGILRYPDSSFYDSNQIVASTGYNHSFTARHAVFATYSYSEFHYTAVDASFTSQNAQLGYSRNTSGRFSFQASGGPEFTDAKSLGVAHTQVQFAGTASLAYSRGRTNLGLSYFAGTTAGSGVMTGAQTQDVQFTAGRSFSRDWTANFSTGYSHNNGLVGQQTYNSLYFSPALRRSLTHNLGVTLNYSYQRQLTQSGCSGLVCGTISRNFVSAGIDYRFRPIHLE